MQIRTELLLNTEIHGQGILCSLFDATLSPWRYFNQGRMVQLHGEGKALQVHYAFSYHPCGARNVSPTTNDLHSSEISMLKTALMVLLLVPGFIFGATGKFFLYLLSSDYNAAFNNIVQDLSKVPEEPKGVAQAVRHQAQELKGAVKAAFNHANNAWRDLRRKPAPVQELPVGPQADVAHKPPVDLSQVLAQKPQHIIQVQAKDAKDLYKKLTAIWRGREAVKPNCPVDALVIEGTGENFIMFDVLTDMSALEQFKAMKIILVWAESPLSCLTDKEKWVRDESNIESVEEGLQRPLRARECFSWKSYHEIFVVADETGSPVKEGRERKTDA